MAVVSKRTGWKWAPLYLARFPAYLSHIWPHTEVTQPGAVPCLICCPWWTASPWGGVLTLLIMLCVLDCDRDWADPWNLEILCILNNLKCVALAQGGSLQHNRTWMWHSPPTLLFLHTLYCFKLLTVKIMYYGLLGVMWRGWSFRLLASSVPKPQQSITWCSTPVKTTVGQAIVNFVEQLTLCGKAARACVRTCVCVEWIRNSQIDQQ